MAGLNHAFFLVRRSEFSPADHARFIALPGDVELHDDLLRYLGDTLRWLPAYNPARDEECAGLCMYGNTIYSTRGSELCGYTGFFLAFFALLAGALAAFFSSARAAMSAARRFGSAHSTTPCINSATMSVVPVRKKVPESVM
jgi:hypothetical protein